MKTFSKLAGLMVLAATLAVMPLAKAAAQSNMDVKPAVVLSVASIDEQIDDVKHMMSAAGMAAFGDLAVGMASQYTEHFNTEMPMGGYITLDDYGPHMIGFMPMEDLDAALKMFRNELGDIEDGANGMKIISMARGEEMFLKESRGFVFMAQSEDDLSNLPSDPSELLDGLNESYNVSARVYAQNIPSEMKEMAIGFIKEGFDQALQSLEQVDPDAADFQGQMNQVTMESLIEMIQQLDEVTIGLAVDASTQSTYVDFTVTGLPDSKLATQIEAASQAESNFGGFINDDAAVTAQFTSVMTEDDLAGIDEMFSQMKDQVLDQIEDEAGLNSMEAELATRVAGDMMDIMKETMKGGVLDGGAAVMLDDDTVALAAGLTVADGSKIKNLAQELIGMVEAEAPPEVDFNADSETYSGIDMRVISIPVPDFEEEMRDIFGNELTIVLGTSDDAAYFALGKNCMSLLKQCIDDSKTAENDSSVSSQVSVSLGKLMQFAASIQDDQVLSMMAETLEGSDNDHLRILSGTVKNGARTRIVLEDDIIKLLGVAGMQLGGDFGPGF